MKYLTIMRHAKSSWDGSWSSDHERPLNKRGKRNAPEMAAALQARFEEKDIPSPQLILSSDAMRTRETAQLLCSIWGREVRVQLENKLYLASVSEMEHQLERAEEDVHHVLVLGHNPGMEEWAFRLAGIQGPERFVTAATQTVSLDIEYWGLYDAGKAKPLFHLCPHDLEEG